MHFQTEGETILKESEESKIQEEIQESREVLMKEVVKGHELADFEGNYDPKLARAILRNKFNYSERMSQTPPMHIKETGVSTAKTKLRNYSGEVNLSWIYDLYVKDFWVQKEEEDKKVKIN